MGRGGGGYGRPLRGVTFPSAPHRVRPPSTLCNRRSLTPPPPCDIPSGCCFFTGPWTVTRSSLRMLRRVAAFCRPLRWPVLLLVLFPRSRSPVVGVLGLCWLLWGSFDCFCCPHTSVHRPSIACLAVFLCGPGALFLHALSRPSTICPFPPHGWSAPDGLPLLLCKQPIWAAGDTPHLMPVEQGLPWHPVATGLAGQATPFIVAASLAQSTTVGTPLVPPPLQRGVLHAPNTHVRCGPGAGGPSRPMSPGRITGPPRSNALGGGGGGLEQVRAALRPSYGQLRGVEDAALKGRGPAGHSPPPPPHTPTQPLGTRGPDLRGIAVVVVIVVVVVR